MITSQLRSIGCDSMKKYGYIYYILQETIVMFEISSLEFCFFQNKKLTSRPN